jgi:anti-sigma B factor antagonist
MLISMRTVTVHEVPAEVTASEERTFLHNLQEYVETERPRLVLDCSSIRRINKPTLHLLLSCLEEAMKRNGDVRLAALPPEARTSPQLAGLRRLFEIYPTVAEAVHSFQQRPAALPPGLDIEALELGAESAA